MTEKKLDSQEQEMLAGYPVTIPFDVNEYISRLDIDIANEKLVWLDAVNILLAAKAKINTIDNLAFSNIKRDVDFNLTFYDANGKILMSNIDKVNAETTSLYNKMYVTTRLQSRIKELTSKASDLRVESAINAVLSLPEKKTPESPINWLKGDEDQIRDFIETLLVAKIFGGSIENILGHFTLRNKIIIGAATVDWKNDFIIVRIEKTQIFRMLHFLVLNGYILGEKSTSKFLKDSKLTIPADYCKHFADEEGVPFRDVENIYDSRDSAFKKNNLKPKYKTILMDFCGSNFVDWPLNSDTIPTPVPK